MTIVFPRRTTAGLNVPAASHPLPRGVMTGLSESLCQAAKGTLPASCAARTASKARSTDTLVEIEWTLCIAHSMTKLFLRTTKNGRADPLPFVVLAILVPDYFLFTDFLSSAPGL